MDFWGLELEMTIKCKAAAPDRNGGYKHKKTNKNIRVRLGIGKNDERA
jgi:hypothetical protein